MQIADRARRRASARSLDDQPHLGPVVREPPPGDDAARFERITDDAEVREDRDAEPLGHHQLAHLGPVRRIGEHAALAGKQPVQVAVHDVAGAHPDQHRRAQVGDGHFRPAGQRVVRPQADNRVAGQQRSGVQFRRHVVAFQDVHQAQVGAAFQEPALDVGLQAADHLHLGSRVCFTELPDGGRQQRHRGRAHRADPHDPADLVLFAGGLAEPVHRVEHDQHVRQQVTAAVAEPGPVPAAFQEVHAQLPLQAAYRFAQRRLRDVQRLGCLPVRAKPGNRGDVLQLFDPHDHKPSRRGCNLRLSRSI
jgi:hypothetical protein